MLGVLDATPNSGSQVGVVVKMEVENEVADSGRF